MASSLGISYGGLESAPRARTLVVHARGKILQGRAAEIFAHTGHDFASLAAAMGFEGRQGQTLDLVMPRGLDADRLLILGIEGDPDGAPAPTVWADRGGSLAGKLDTLGVTRADIVVDEAEATPALLAELCAGVALRRYTFAKYRTVRPDRTRPLDLRLLTRWSAELAEPIADRMAVAEGTMIARDLVNEPANALGPDEFALRAGELAALGVRVETLDEREMEALGMGALLAVGRGSARRPRLVVLEWRGGAAKSAPLALVGKGVVFDSGGLSIKAAASMEDMKGDMGGAAAIVGLFHALARRKATVNVVAVIGLVENMPDGGAYRPGDILKTMSGKTVEVTNTDAEGRLVLADALWYTQQRFAPVAMIDIATLTGAVLVTLGHGMAGLFSNTGDLVADLHGAGTATGELVWHLPLAPYFEKLIESRFADIRNVGGRKGAASSAAHFLAHFVNDVPWAHIDIAGMAFGPPASETNTSWATGFGVALLDRYIRNRHER